MSDIYMTVVVICTGLSVGASLGLAGATRRRLAALPCLLAISLPFALEGVSDWLAVTYLISVAIAAAAVLYLDGEFGLVLSTSKGREHVPSEAGQ